MNTKSTPYWDERTLLMYGLLGGYTQLSHKEIEKAVNGLTNANGNVLFCLDILATLEEQRSIRTSGVWLDIRKYLTQIDDEPESDEITELRSKVQDIADWELDSKEVLRTNFTELLENRAVISEVLHDCIEFDVEILERKWIQGIVQSYLELYHQNELYSPTVSYQTYHQQYTELINYLDKADSEQTLRRFLISPKVRFFEILFDLVDKNKLSIESIRNLNTPEAISQPTFNVKISKDKSTKPKSSRRIDLNNVKLEARSYDAANGILTILGEPIQIIRQKNMKGKLIEKNPGKLMRLLFHPNTFPDPVPIKNIFYVDLRITKEEYYPDDVLKNTTSLVADINDKIQETFSGITLIKHDDWKFSIEERYLKK